MPRIYARMQRAAGAPRGGRANDQSPSFIASTSTASCCQRGCAVVIIIVPLRHGSVIVSASGSHRSAQLAPSCLAACVISWPAGSMLARIEACWPGRMLRMPARRRNAAVGLMAASTDEADSRAETVLLLAVFGGGAASGDIRRRCVLSNMRNARYISACQ